MPAARTPVVMIHGAFCGPWAFEHFRKPFEAQGHAVHAPVLRHHDHGHNPPAALGQVSLLDYAHDLSQLVKGLGEPPVVIGHSLGGLLAQMLAARGLARALVLLAPSAPWGVMPSTMFELASSQTLFFAQGDYRGSVIRPSYRIAAAHSLDKLAPAERSAVYARFVPESGQATFETMHWSFDHRRAARVAARDVSCPILCLVGSDDRINPPSTVKRIAGRYNGQAVLEELPGTSHWLIGEPGWAQIAQRAADWVKAL
ncbi:MAG: alpha/beta hydrolase [Alphaproteobacteria bacterium]|nr:alpha/beta hydrolase [Alphaproteobacteria bacterium]MBV9692475.1 alpha/beta hydrolase [Alphaproteobacteria bacterium]